MKKVMCSILLAISSLSLSCCFVVTTPSTSTDSSNSEKESSSSESFSSEESISSNESVDSSINESSSPSEESSSPSEEIIEGFSINVTGENGKIAVSKNSNILEGEEVAVNFTPNGGYSLLAYTITDENGSIKVPAYGKSSTSLTITSDTTIDAEYIKNSLVESFNYSSGNSKLFHYVNGGYQNSSEESVTYDEVISCIKDQDGNPIDSSIFSVSPITTFENGKWANLYYTKNSYGLSLYSSETEYSGITFNSTKTIYSIKVTYYSKDYYSRASVESNGATLSGFKEDEAVYTYLIDGNSFSITNVSEGKYLYIPSIEILYEGEESLEGPITIKYDANGGEGEMDDQVVESSSFNLNENQFSKLGFNFVGWSTSPNGEMLYGDGESISGSIAGDTTLYALYLFEPTKAHELLNIYKASLTGNYADVYAYYGGKDEHDITKYIPTFDPALADYFELQLGNIVYVGSEEYLFDYLTSNFIPVSQSYKTVTNKTLLDAYLELAYSYYYQGTQIQYDQGSSYQRKIRNMKPEDATELYQKYMDCSTFVSNAFYNAFGDTVIPNESLNDITTKTIINFARDNINKSSEVILYQDNLLNLTASEKSAALAKFKANLQPGDLYVYRHGVNSESGHVMLYVGNGYFLHSTGGSYNYTSQTDRTEGWTSVEGTENPEGSVRYQSVNTTVYKESSTRYLFYVDPEGVDSNTRYAILRPLNRKGLAVTSTTVARNMAPGIEIEKSADKTTSVTLGDTLTYTISIKNNSNKTINNVSITDEVPNYTSFVNTSSSYSFARKEENLMWNIPSVGAGKTVNVSYSVLVSDETSNIGKKISSTGKVGHLSLNTLNMSISSLNNTQLNDLVTMALQYYNNSNVYYASSATNSTLDPTQNVVTFSSGSQFIIAFYKRYYASLGKNLNLGSELSSITNTNFMNSIMDTSGNLPTNTLLGKMLVNGGYGGTVYTKNYDMDRMRTVREEYLLPGDIISFNNSSATNQYLYLGDIKIGSKNYRNALLLFTTSNGVKLIYGTDADALLVKFIGYKRFAVIRPSLYI